MYKKLNKGFTLVELLITMGIAVVLGGVAMSNYFGYQSSVTIDGAASELLGTLRDAQQRAISQDQQLAWGVYVNSVTDGPDYYEIFSGSTRATGAVLARTTLASDLEFLVPVQGSVVEINFAKSTGLPNNDYTLILISKRNASLARTINFNVSTGLITTSTDLGSGPTVSSITPNSALNNAPVNITSLAGSNFQPGAILKLTKIGNADLICTNISYVNSSLLTGTCDVTGKSGGVWDVVVVNPDAQFDALPSAFTLTGVSVPGLIASLTPTGGNQQVVLNWSAPVDNGGSAVTSYKVYRSTTSGAEVLLSSGGCSGLGNVLTCTDTGLTNGTTYYYKVSAVNAIGEGIQSSEVSITPSTTPTAPQNFAVTAGAQQLVLNWTAPTSNGGSAITNYEIYRGTSSGSETFLTEVGNVLTYTNSGLTNGITYYYKVAAKNSVGIGTQSTESSATTFTTPSAPQTLVASAGKQKVILTWTAPSSTGGSAVTNYEIYRGTTSGGETLLTEIGNVLTYSDAGLSNGTAYYYKVAAKNAVGIGTQSTESSATTLSEWRRIFVTSTTYTGNLGGLSGADTSCQTRANALSLGGTWKAWLSSETVNASDRLYHDTVAYINMNSDKVADNWTDLTDGSLDGAIQYNESGVVASGQAWTGSYSSGLSYFSQDCTAWTSTTGVTGDAGLSGIVTSSTGTWSYNGTNSCNTSLPLYCVEQPPITAPEAPQSLLAIVGNQQLTLTWQAPSNNGGSAITNYKVYRSTTSGGETLLTTGGCANLGNVLTCTDTGLTNETIYYYKIAAVNVMGVGTLSSEKLGYPGGKIIFVSSASYTGNLGGLSGADTKCNTLSAAAGLTGAFKAWLSTSVESAASRNYHSSFAYVNPLGELIASNWNDLIDGAIVIPINVDETKASAANLPWSAHSATDCAGNWYNPSGNIYDCGNWTSTGGNDYTGNINGNSCHWSAYGSTYCSNAARIYCVEQPWVCGNNLVDTRNNKAYTTVQIGTQCWMAQNLDVGTKITSCTNGFVSGTTSCTSGGDTVKNQGTSCSSIQKYCYSDNESNCTTYGGLYQWNQAMCGSTTPGDQGICPTGWYLPTDADQYILENYLKDSGQTCSSTRASTFECVSAGTKLKTGGSSNFNLALGGLRHNLGYFLNVSVDSFLWSSDYGTSSVTTARYLTSSSAGVGRMTSMGKEYGFPVRCIKKGAPYSPTIGTATAVGATSVSVAFTAPISNGGSAVTSYTVTSNPGGIIATGASSPITVSGLTSGTAYTFTVTATNALGTGPSSSASNSVTPVWTCGRDNVADSRDGKSYTTVLIGSQCWFKENLTYIDGICNTKTFINGTDNGYCVAGAYGWLYQWSLTSASAAFCPSGWHVATDGEFTTLANYLGGESVAGGPMKETGTTYWASPNTGATNSSGFSGRAEGGNQEVLYWTSSDGLYGFDAWARKLNYSSTYAARNDPSKFARLPIRCLKN